MKNKAIHNFHLPLPDETYRKLKSASKHLSTPATALARDAIDRWLAMQEKEEIAHQIETYAQSMAGSELDLDDALESASVEHLLAEDAE